MILRRLTGNLRSQNWTAIAIELVIVIVGVFIGMQVSNWNDERLEKREVHRMLSQFQPELEAFADFFQASREYYATTRAYADTAFAGWEGRTGVTDQQFVIAAYQASQITGSGLNAENWALIFGGDQLRKIEDPDLRRAMSNLMAGSFEAVDAPVVATKYREDVRRVIPDKIQAAIRAHCGDRADANRPLVSALPKTCDLKLADDEAANAAAALRANPQLVGELHWHLAAVASFLQNAETLEAQTRNLAARIARS